MTALEAKASALETKVTNLAASFASPDMSVSGFLRLFFSKACERVMWRVSVHIEAHVPRVAT